MSNHRLMRTASITFFVALLGLSGLITYTVRAGNGQWDRLGPEGGPIEVLDSLNPQVAHAGPLLPDDLDTTFNSTGIVTTSISGLDDFAFSLAVQPDGKTVVAGLSDSDPSDATIRFDADVAVVRYEVDGSLDSSFNGTGIVTTTLGSGSGGGSQNAVAIQPDGMIVVAASINNDDSYNNSDFAVLRFQSNGAPDQSFINGTHIVTTSIGSNIDGVSDVAIQPDGKIVVAGHTNNSTDPMSTDFDFALVRYDSGGSLDMTFNGTGIITTPIGNGDDFGVAMDISPEGKIVLAGANYGDAPSGECAVVRYNDNGSLDPEFNGTGIVTTPCDVGGVYNVAIQPDGKIVTVGFDFIMRYNNDGSLDTSFNGTGVVTLPIIGEVVTIQPDNTIIVAGSLDLPDSAFAVARYLDNGTLDTSFNQAGIVTTSVGTLFDDFGSLAGFDSGEAVASLPDGNIVVAGYSYWNEQAEFTVLRYIGDPQPVAFLPVIVKG